jgi:hypothetical protein
VDWCQYTGRVPAHWRAGVVAPPVNLHNTGSNRPLGIYNAAGTSSAGTTGSAAQRAWRKIATCSPRLGYGALSRPGNAGTLARRLQPPAKEGCSRLLVLKDRRIRLGRPAYDGIENMLRITVMEEASEERWILQGRLTKQSIDELVSSWRASTAQPSMRRRIVDLNEVTSIDRSGEQALSMMVHDGATFVASGVYTRTLLDQLQARRTHQRNSD